MRGFLPFEGHIHKVNGLQSQHLTPMERLSRGKGFAGGRGRGAGGGGFPLAVNPWTPLFPLTSLPMRGFLFRSRKERVGSAQMCPRCGNQLRLIFRLDYLAYLMIFASLLSSIVFTRTAGY